ncbi:hypothetical protein HYS97_02490, partial [Candidatus Daviesbacteria bacterium]|nr:hypothetical protein [Candidatus Daviesbacteria bacterium]
MAVEINQPKPLKDLYDRGLLTKGEFRTLAQPLATYLTERGFKRNVRVYNTLVTRYPGEIFPGYSTHLNYRPVNYPFSVDSQVMDTKIEEFNDAMDEILRNGHPFRSALEKSEYRKQLLREPQADGTFKPVPEDEAFSHLWRFGMYILGHLDLSEKEEILAGSVVRMLPFLQGERGDFENFRNFRSYFRVVVINARNGHYRGRKREYRALSRLAKQVNLYTPSEVETSEDSTLQKFTITDED